MNINKLLDFYIYGFRYDWERGHNLKNKLAIPIKLQYKSLPPRGFTPRGFAAYFYLVFSSDVFVFIFLMERYHLKVLSLNTADLFE